MEARPQFNDKLFSPSYILLMLVSLITAMGYSMIATLISTYAVSIGEGLGVAGTLGGIYSLAALLVRPLGGLAADKLNKKKLCMIFTCLISFSIAGYALSPNIVALFASRILHGAAFGISSTVNIALVSECIPKKRLGEGLGYYGMGQVLSQICGPALGVHIRELWGYEKLFLLISGLSLVPVAILAMMQYQSPVPQFENNKEKVPVPRFSNLIAVECLAYSLVGGMFSLGNGIVNAFLLLVGEQRDIRGISLFFSVSAIILFVVRLFVGRITDRSDLTLVTNISLILTAVSMLILGWAASLPLILTAAAFKALGQGGGQISLQSACIKRVRPERIGVATSTFYIGADIGQGFGPILGGQLSAHLGYGLMYTIIAIVMLLIMFGFNIYQRLQTGGEI